LQGDKSVLEEKSATDNENQAREKQQTQQQMRLLEEEIMKLRSDNQQKEQQIQELARELASAESKKTIAEIKLEHETFKLQQVKQI
jgi:hypothetical protein